MSVWDKSLNNKFAVIQPVEKKKEVKKQADSFYKNGNANVSSNPFVMNTSKQKIAEYSSKSHEGSNIYNKSIGNSKEYINARVNEMLDEYDVIKKTKYGSEFNSSVNNLMNRNDDVLTEFARQNGIARNQVTIPGLIYRFQDQRIKKNPMIGVNANINKFGGNTFENNPFYQQQKLMYKERERKENEQIATTFREEYGKDLSDFNQEDYYKWATEHGFRFMHADKAGISEGPIIGIKNSEEAKKEEKLLRYLLQYNNRRKEIEDDNFDTMQSFSYGLRDSVTYNTFKRLEDWADEKDMNSEYGKYAKALDEKYKVNFTDIESQIQEEHPIASGAGNFTGEMLKYKAAKAIIGQGINGIKFLKNASPKAMSLIEEAASTYLNQSANTLGSGGSFGEALASGGKAVASDMLWDWGFGKVDDAFRIAKKMPDGSGVKKAVSDTSVSKNILESVDFSKRYHDLTPEQHVKYDRGKRGDVTKAYDIISELLLQSTVLDDIDEGVYLLPVMGIEGTSDNVLPRITAEHISKKTNNPVFIGIYKQAESNSRGKAIWSRMKENYPEFDISDDISYNDIKGKKFILIDDNSTTGRTFKGLENFINEKGGEVVGYSALTVGHDSSEKMIVTDETWDKIKNLGLDDVKAFAERKGVKREISRTGLTEREGQELIKQYSTKIDKSRRNGFVSKNGAEGKRIQSIYGNDGSKGASEKGSPEERLINAVGEIGRIRFVPRKPEEQEKKQETRPVFRMREEFRIPNWDDRIRDEISAEKGRPVFRRKYF